jgi:hypothetical protein
MGCNAAAKVAGIKISRTAETGPHLRVYQYRGRTVAIAATRFHPDPLRTETTIKPPVYCELRPPFGPLKLNDTVNIGVTVRG